MKRVNVSALVRFRTYRADVINVTNVIVNNLKRQGFNVSIQNVQMYDSTISTYLTGSPRYVFSTWFYVNNNYPISNLKNIFARAINPYAIIVSTSSQLGSGSEGNDEVEGDDKDVSVMQEISDTPDNSTDNYVEKIAWAVGAALLTWLITKN